MCHVEISMNGREEEDEQTKGITIIRSRMWSHCHMMQMLNGI